MELRMSPIHLIEVGDLGFLKCGEFQEFNVNQRIRQTNCRYLFIDRFI